MALVRTTFTKHATDKFDLLLRFGFKVSQEVVIGAISAPDRVERKGLQTFSTKALDKEFALRVCTKSAKAL